ncbi:hypothetical protein TYRP_017699 [Tyrophagus putrescentiae]|nr:hypothetical protein TYRP_017699 [Tyrophagus putrescentiae]
MERRRSTEAHDQWPMELHSRPLIGCQSVMGSSKGEEPLRRRCQQQLESCAGQKCIQPYLQIQD